MTAPCPNTTSDVGHTGADLYLFQDDALAFLTLGAVLYPRRASYRCVPVPPEAVLAELAALGRSMIQRLFVYGTLAPGRPNEHLLNEIGGSWEEANSPGILFGNWFSFSRDLLFCELMRKWLFFHEFPLNPLFIRLEKIDFSCVPFALVRKCGKYPIFL